MENCQSARKPLESINITMKNNTISSLRKLALDEGINFSNITELPHKDEFWRNRNHPARIPNELEIGVGAQSFVYRAIRDPHSVVKTIKIRGTPETDSHLLFLKMAEKYSNNPFLPKIKHVKLYVRRHPTYPPAYFATVVMEKLVSIRELLGKNMFDMEFLMALLRNSGLEEVAEEIIRTYPDLGSKAAYLKMNPHFADDYSRIQYYLEVIEGLLTGFKIRSFVKSIIPGDKPAAYAKLTPNIKNRYLIQAVKIVRKISDDPIVKLDFQTGNFMIRLTRHGPEPVITDPVINKFDFAVNTQ